MGTEDAALVYQNILLGGRGGMNPGQLKVHPEGFVWRKTGGGKVVEVAKDDISSVMWMRVPKGYQLALRLKAGSRVKFNGFREQDVPNLNPFMTSNLGQTPKQKEIAVSGRNWGDAEVEGSMLSFNIGGKQAFEVAIADVSQTQMQGKNEVMLELHVDDTTGANEKDTLMELSFHVPTTNTAYLGDDEKPSAQVFKEKILARADVGPSGDESVVDFESVHILTPRGRFKVELHISFLRLQGQAMDFKIQYAAVVRVFVLPKANQPHTFVVVMLDPPIRKGQTFYPHLVLQFPNEDTMNCQLAMSEELLEGKYKGRLESSYKGLVYEAFVQVLKGLSGAKVTKPGGFRSNTDGRAVRASLKAEEGYLYPLEKSFFFLPKPPTLITHDEVEHVEFERHGAGSSTVSSSYFDLVIHLKSDTEHQFRNIQRNEYHNLFNFFSSKKLKILNLGESKGVASGGAVAAAFQDVDEGPGSDPYLNIKTAREGGPAGEESDEEDEDFVAEKDDEGSPTDDSGGEGGEGEGDSDSEGGEDEDEKPKEREKKKEKEKEREREKEKEKEKEKEREKPPKAAAATKRKKKGDDEEGGSQRKKRAKKDPNAPKRSMTAFLLFSQEQRETMKKENPKIGFGEMGKALGEKWKTLSAEEKEPYEQQAKQDKKRYDEQMADYKGSGGGAGGGEAGSDRDEE